MERYICIHGHFYQPPRENPWLESVELQHSAYPYHDWNERITAECYAPNAASRILDNQNCISAIVNNYAKMSFNIGPTLLSWLETNSPQTYAGILQADRDSQEAFGGHGSAMAQAYSHMIMPLANRRDKYTQIRWGMADFEHRFGHPPEGMWLPETAVDVSTLDIMAELGIKFTVLAQTQARQVRPIGNRNWTEVSGGRIDPTTAYEVHLFSGKKIAVFFYDGPMSRAVAFEGLLWNGENFANRLMGGFSSERTWPQLVSIATDGESYGHHHRFGDMALAYALRLIEADSTVKLTNYGEYLEKHPPTHEVKIIDNTSWSCVHGVDRWRGDCGCNSGGHPGWNQSWRAPLRESLDWLRGTLASKFEDLGSQLLTDPWAARDDYIRVILDRSQDNVAGFLASNALHELDESERIRTLKLMEMQRHAMLMYTSCGWFFDELSGIETVQVIQYACRAVQLARELFGDRVEERFLAHLEKAKSNIEDHRDGRLIYDKFVKTTMIDLPKVGAHYAISSLFEDYGGRSPTIYCYAIECHDYQRADCGKTRLAVGRVRVASQIILESQMLSFGVAHFGDHNINAGVRTFQGKEAYEGMLQEMVRSCEIADFPSTVRLLDKHFGESTYSLRTLFRDEQTKILGKILGSTLDEIDSAYRQVYQSNFPLMRFLADAGQQLPAALKAAAEFVLNADLRRAVGKDPIDDDSVRRLLADAVTLNVPLDTLSLGHAFRNATQNTAAGMTAEPSRLEQITRTTSIVRLGRSLPFAVDLGPTQNVYYQMVKTAFPGFRQRAEAGDQAAREWIAEFAVLGKELSMCVET